MLNGSVADGTLPVLSGYTGPLAGLCGQAVLSNVLLTFLYLGRVIGYASGQIVQLVQFMNDWLQAALYNHLWLGGAVGCTPCQAVLFTDTCI